MKRQIEHVTATDSFLRKVKSRYLLAFCFLSTCFIVGCTTGSMVCVYNNSSSDVDVKWDGGGLSGRFAIDHGKEKCIGNLKAFFEFNMHVIDAGQEYMFTVDVQDKEYWNIGSMLDLKRRVHRVQINEGGFLFYIKAEESFPVNFEDSLDVNKVYRLQGVE